MNQQWYLGLDISTSHLSAVLINGDRQQQYPLFWQNGDQQQFSLPMTVTASDSLSQPWQIAVESGLVSGKTLNGWLPFLRLAPTYQAEVDGTWLPTLPWSTPPELPLKSLSDALVFLLCVLRDRSVVSELSPTRVRDIFGRLAGVIVSLPSNWGDTYRLNIREVLRQVSLVNRGEQVLFVSGAIATLLGFQAQLPHTEGGTLIIHSDESHTDLAVVDLPSYLPQLKASQIHSHSFDYGGSALQQDILCQLIYPQWLPQLQDALSKLAKIMPRAGEIDLERRLLAAWQWRNSPVGRSLLQAANQTKMLLQQRAEFAAHLGQQEWRVIRPELERKVIYPFQQQLNQQINHLFAKAGVMSQGIQQIICSGSNFEYCDQWLTASLQQKFPQAELIRNTAPSQISRIAVGLGLVPLMPQVIDNDRHRYHDYFLLGILLKILPSEPFRLDTLHRLFQAEGINDRNFGDRLQGLLFSQRPAGLAPELDEQQGNVFRQYPMGNTPATALCWQDDDGFYHLNEAQRDHFLEFWGYLQQSYDIEILEPYGLPFGRSPLQLSSPDVPR
ncbi:hypothetical protein Lepto7376_4308 [[Leptolyngbya] sp. PCC 7376]|uniref:hypothetical protein n=1 Tax=[Leptolyngbya] sp. PCC 7376 TaxID=111781 RepID=UPI00029F0514|nr:hypothetical protein [[Leptolyngbya] sp. PCC 7376]AFY40417.1 hypothetical protein Lepto7376_4308 [[Leptolyngbya] sp. PCC 7376]